LRADTTNCSDIILFINKACYLLSKQNTFLRAIKVRYILAAW
jgi:hypothetical protein